MSRNRISRSDGFSSSCCVSCETRHPKGTSAGRFPSAVSTSRSHSTATSFHPLSACCFTSAASNDPETTWRFRSVFFMPTPLPKGLGTTQHPKFHAQPAKSAVLTTRCLRGCRALASARGRKCPESDIGLQRLTTSATRIISFELVMIQTLFGSLEEEKKTGFLDRMKQAVTRTRENLAERIEEVVAFTKEIDRNTLDDLEATLIGADLGTTTTQEILSKLREKADRKQIGNVEELKRLLKEELLAILNTANGRPVNKVEGAPEVILVVGVNGTGKTTTIGKLSQVFRSQGKNVLLCAADTFRAAAIDQLEIWGQRTGTEVIKTKPGGDPAAVLFDALQAGTARKTDYVVVDTAGRLHTKSSLMSELDKMRRTAQRIIPGAPHETLLVMDATTGQNGLQQARMFTESAGVTGIVLTKIDGTAKGGVVVAISRELGLPVRYVGVGEKAGDLLPFNAKDFVDSLFA